MMHLDITLLRISLDTLQYKQYSTFENAENKVPILTVKQSNSVLPIPVIPMG